MKTGHIYKITSPSGAIYIGKSTNIKLRFADYRRLRCKTQPKLYNSFLKHGVQNHIFEIIDESLECNLSELEIYYISKFNSRASGMNCTKGGDGAFMSGEDNVAKKPEVKAKMSEAKKRYFRENSHVSKGIKRTKETKSKIKMKRATQQNIYSDMCIDLQTGFFFNSKKEASMAFNQNYKSFVYQMSKQHCRFVSLTQKNKEKHSRKGLLVLDFQTGVYYENANLAFQSQEKPKTTFVRALNSGKSRFRIV